MAEKFFNPIIRSAGPDFDNVQKQIVDALYYKRSRFDRKKGDEDARISSSAIIKVWVPDDVAPGFYINEYDPREWDNSFLTQHMRRLALPGLFTE